jgi:hypothetical protein
VLASVACRNWKPLSSGLADSTRWPPNQQLIGEEAGEPIRKTRRAPGGSSPAGASNHRFSGGSLN